MPPPPARPPVRYLRGGGFGPVGYPRIDLEMSATLARVRRLDASLRALTDEVARMSLEVDEVQAGMKMQADECDEQMDELEREVNAILAASAIRVDPVRLAAAKEMTRQATGLVATSKARLVAWRERNDRCQRKFEAVDRKRQRILLVLDKFQYLHRAALMPPAPGARAAHYNDDDDSD
jgi:TolA-binding protein